VERGGSVEAAGLSGVTTSVGEMGEVAGGCVRVGVNRRFPATPMLAIGVNDRQLRDLVQSRPAGVASRFEFRIATDRVVLS
jgi:hypothetical protein